MSTDSRQAFLSQFGQGAPSNAAPVGGPRPAFAGGGTVKTGSFHGKSNALGHGGRAAQLKAKGVPGGVIGAIARRKGAAPGGPNFHGSRGRRGS